MPCLLGKPRDVYKWQELEDTELAQALALAQDALDAANDKAKIFVSLFLDVGNVVIVAVAAYEANNAAYFVVIQIEVALTAAAALNSPIEENIRQWVLTTATYTNLKPATAYYIYARCSTTAGNGTIILSYQSAGVLAARVGYDAVKHSDEEVIIPGFLFYGYGT